MPPRLKDRALNAVQAGLEASWAAGFRALGRLLPARPRLWDSPGGARVLVVAPHPDDEVAGCAGTLRRHRLAGDHVTVVVVTDGRKSRAGGLAPEEMSALRRREAEAVAARLDVELRWLGVPEGEWREEPVRGSLAAALEREAPAVLYAPSSIDFHPEHVAVARALASALPDGSAVRVRVYPVQVPLTSALANLVSPVGALIPDTAAAMRLYASQTESLSRCLRARSYGGARHALGEPAEEFWEMSADEYRRLHGVPEAVPCPFRGLRGFALTDPLAYAAGRRERRRLRQQAYRSGG